MAAVHLSLACINNTNLQGTAMDEQINLLRNM